MPPKRGIVKSGNAGNSSKSVVGSLAAADSQKSQDNLLFPPGYKYPLSLLNERYAPSLFEEHAAQRGHTIFGMITIMHPFSR